MGQVSLEYEIPQAERSQAVRLIALTAALGANLSLVLSLTLYVGLFQAPDALRLTLAWTSLLFGIVALATGIIAAFKHPRQARRRWPLGLAIVYWIALAVAVVFLGIS